MDNKLPIFKAVINDDDLTGVEFVSLVKSPAIEINWQAFTNKMRFTTITEKQKLAGPLMVPDMPIYRFDAEMGEYYIVFDAEQIQLMADKFNKNTLGKNLNFEHSERTVAGYVSENWITTENDKSKQFGFDLPVGTWFGVIKIEDNIFWTDDVKSGNVMGFSIEGLFSMDKIKNESMKKLIMAEAKLADGTLFVSDTEVFAVGDDVFLQDADGNRVAAEDNEYVIEDGTVIKTVGGKIDSIIAPTDASEELEFADYEVDGGGMLRAEALEIGKEAIFVQDGTEVIAEGEYFLVDGTNVKCEGGVITEVSIPASEVPAEMAMTPEETQAIIDSVMSIVQPLLDELNGTVILQEERIAALEAALTGAVASNEEMSKKIEAFSMLPGAKPATKKSAFVIEAKMTFDEKLNRLKSINK